MGWKEDYLPASFNNAKFFIRNVRTSGGRRLASHQYPHSEITEHEDLGAKDVVFSFDGYVLGDDYFDARNRLETEFQRGTVGTLVHPYRGKIDVVVESYSIAESAARGGAAFFSITFLKDEGSTVRVTVDRAQAVENARQTLDTAAEEWLEEEYTLSDKSSFVAADVSTTLDKSFSFIENAKRSAATAAEFKRDVANAIGRVDALRVSAGAIAFTYKGLIDFGVAVGEKVSDDFTSKDQLREQRQLVYSTKSPLVETSEATGNDYPAKQIQNYMALTAMSSWMSLITQTSFGSVSEAENERDLLFDEINEALENESFSDDLLSALRDAKQTVHDYIQDNAINLPIIINVDLMSDTNALALSYDRYGNLDEADNIVERNGLIHPGFILKNTTVQLRVFSE